MEKTIFKNYMTGKEKALGWAFIVPGFIITNGLLANFLTIYAIKYFPQIKNIGIPVLNILLNIIYGLITFLMIVFILKRFAVEEIKSFFKDKLSEKVWIPVGYLCCFILNIIFGLIIMIFLGPKQSSNQALVESLMKTMYPLMFIQTVILAPIVEEFVFRGVIFRSIRPYSKILAHFISAFLFGFVHVSHAVFSGDLSQMLFVLSYGGIGLVMSVIYEYKGSIIYPIGVHMLNNFIASLLIMFVR